MRVCPRPAALPLSPLACSPKKSLAPEEKCTPPTPKTKLLDDWNSENRSLKALIETERFEKGYLEIQLKQSEDRVNELVAEHRRCLDEIHHLRNEQLSTDTENIAPNQNGQEYQVFCLDAAVFLFFFKLNVRVCVRRLNVDCAKKLK